jgi:hypothetical protein
MEKIVYLLWKPEGESPDAFRDRLLRDVARGLLDAGALRLQVNAADSAVAPAAGARMVCTRPQPDALVSLWLHTHTARRAVEGALAAAAPRSAGYLVAESEPIVNTDQRTSLGQRTPGYAQIALIQRPPRVAPGHWIEIWQGSHTKVAIETQSTFRYVQNAVVRPLTHGAPSYDAIVEEGFPAAAMTSLEAFYDAVGDKEKLRANQTRMVESCQRFIDFDKIDVIPTSEYVLRA